MLQERLPIGRLDQAWADPACRLIAADGLEQGLGPVRSREQCSNRTRADRRLESSQPGQQNPGHLRRLALGQGPHRGNLHGQRLSRFQQFDKNDVRLARIKRAEPSDRRSASRLRRAWSSRTAVLRLVDHASPPAERRGLVEPAPASSRPPDRLAPRARARITAVAQLSPAGIIPLRRQVIENPIDLDPLVARTHDLGKLIDQQPRGTRTGGPSTRASSASSDSSTSMFAAASEAEQSTAERIHWFAAYVRSDPQQCRRDPRIIALSDRERRLEAHGRIGIIGKCQHLASKQRRRRAQPPSRELHGRSTHLGNRIIEPAQNVTIFKCFQSVERPERIDSRLGQGGSLRAQHLSQRLDRRGVLPFIDQAMGRVAVPGVAAPERGDQARPSAPGSIAAAGVT